MATAALVAQPTRTTPLALWHLLSLDAPTVAALWLIFAARATHTPIPSALPIAMFLAVWLLYAVDRLLDAHLLDARSPSHNLEPRHHFHRTHRTRFAFAILIATSTLAVLVPTLPLTLLRPYLLLAAALLAWFALIHLTRFTLPKEFVPGFFFSAALFIPIHPPPAAALAFTALCILNCLYIYHWESPHTAPPHITTRLALRYLPQLTIALATVPLLVSSPTPLSVAISLAAILLLVLNHYHRRLAATTLRASADLALLTPLLILPFLK